MSYYTYTLPYGFQRVSSGPLDSTSVYSSLTALTSYAATNGTAYPGQILALSGLPTTIYTVNSDLTVTAISGGSVSGGGSQTLSFVDTTSAYNLTLSNGNTVSLSALGYQNLSASNTYLTIQSYVNNYIAPNNIQIPKGYTVSLYNNRMYIFAGTNPSDPNQYLQVNLNPHLPIYVAIPLSGSGGTIIDTFSFNSFKTAKYTLQVEASWSQDVYYSEVNLLATLAPSVYCSEYGQIASANLINGYTADVDNQATPTVVNLSAVYTPIPGSNKVIYIKGLRTNHFLI